MSQTRPAQAKPLLLFMFGSDHSAEISLRSKIRACERLGTQVIWRHYTAVDDRAIDDAIDSIRQHKASAGGVIVQRPVDERVLRSLLAEIPVELDIDGLRRSSTSAAGCTCLAVIGVLKALGVLGDDRVVSVIGSDGFIGSQLVAALRAHANLQMHAFASPQDVARRNETITSSEVVISAASSEVVLRKPFRSDSILIDVGFISDEKGARGSVAAAHCAAPCRLVTPVPGGVGPLEMVALAGRLSGMSANEIEAVIAQSLTIRDS